MNPIVPVVRFFIRGLPWGMAGALGATVGSVAVRGARSAGAGEAGGATNGIEPASGQLTAGLDLPEEGPRRPRVAIDVEPVELVAGALAGRLIAVLVRPRVLGAFVAGLAAGSLVAATDPAGERSRTHLDLG